MPRHHHATRRRARAGRLALALAAIVGIGLPLGAQETSGRKDRSTSQEQAREKARAKAAAREQARERARERPRARDEMRARLGRDDGPARTRIDTTVALDARGLVELSLGGGDVVVRTWDRAEVRVHAEAEDGRLVIDATAARLLLGDTHGGDAHYEVTMPRTARLAIAGSNAEVVADGVRGGVTIENSTGDVRLADVGGLVRVELMTGEVRVDGGEGDFRLSLASGDVTLRGVAGRVEVQSVSGDIAVTGARARELRLETTSGSLSYEGTVQAEGTYELSTHSGDVELRLPEGTRARLEAETYNGEFTSDFPVTMQPSAPLAGRPQRRYELLVGDGGGPLVRIESFNGDIHLARAATLRPDTTRTNR